MQVISAADGVFVASGAGDGSRQVADASPRSALASALPTAPATAIPSSGQVSASMSSGPDGVQVFRTGKAYRMDASGKRVLL
jgi:hypothetical protein